MADGGIEPRPPTHAPYGDRKCGSTNQTSFCIPESLSYSKRSKYNADHHADPQHVSRWRLRSPLGVQDPPGLPCRGQGCYQGEAPISYSIAPDMCPIAIVALLNPIRPTQSERSKESMTFPTFAGQSQLSYLDGSLPGEYVHYFVIGRFGDVAISSNGPVLTIPFPSPHSQLRLRPPGPDRPCQQWWCDVPRVAAVLRGALQHQGCACAGWQQCPGAKVASYHTASHYWAKPIPTPIVGMRDAPSMAHQVNWSRHVQYCLRHTHCSSSPLFR